MLWLGSCAADGEPDEPAPEPGHEPFQEPAREPSSERSVPPVPAQESTVESADTSADRAVPSPEARIFGFGTSCSRNPCRNGGTCVEQWLGFTCRCASGFTGTTCQTSTSGGVARCGDGVRQLDEECDDGNSSNTDACVNCRAARCGDGYILAGVEDCEPDVGGWNVFSCRSSDCKRVNFNRCSVNANCASGEHCGVTGGGCSSGCTTAANCASVPGSTSTCTEFGMCALRCGSLGDCPTGLRCATSYGLCVQDTGCCGPDFGCEGCFFPGF